MVTWRKSLVGVLGAVMLVASGCGSSRSATRVDESWMARVPEEQLGDVRDAQTERRKAADEVTRAEVARSDAERALEVARRNEEAAKLRKKADETALDAAKAKGQQTEISQAEAAMQGTDTAVAAAQAEVTWRKQALDTLAANKQLRERELEVADAKLAQSEYLALKESGDVRAQSLSEADFAGAVASAQRKVEEARRDVDERTQKEQQARARWEQLREQARGYGGSGPESETP